LYRTKTLYFSSLIWGKLEERRREEGRERREEEKEEQRRKIQAGH
jgi:hypothetical protein